MSEGTWIEHPALSGLMQVLKNGSLQENLVISELQAAALGVSTVGKDPLYREFFWLQATIWSKMGHYRREADAHKMAVGFFDSVYADLTLYRARRAEFLHHLKCGHNDTAAKLAVLKRASRKTRNSATILLGKEEALPICRELSFDLVHLEYWGSNGACKRFAPECHTDVQSFIGNAEWYLGALIEAVRNNRARAIELARQVDSSVQYHPFALLLQAELSESETVKVNLLRDIVNMPVTKDGHTAKALASRHLEQIKEELNS